MKLYENTIVGASLVDIGIWTMLYC